MTDDALNKLRAEMEASIAAYPHAQVKLDPRVVLRLLNIIEHQRVEIENMHEYTPEDLV